MLKLRRWYNQNRKTIWKVAVIVVFLIIVLQLLNFFAGINNNVEYNNLNMANSSKQEYTDLSVSTDKSVLSNEKISSSKSEGIEVINNFFSYCNKGDIKKAYDLITDECKEIMYPKLEDFQANYYKIVFNGKEKNISLENWIGDIYKVEIGDDILSTGQYDKNKTKQDYVTVKKVGDSYKLNINKYIETTQINQEETFYNNIQINVEKKEVYMDYEIYTFKINNNLDNPILLDSLNKVESMYLADINNIKYSAYTHEISLEELLINSKETRTFRIKYYNKFGSGKKIENIIFSNVIIDYYSYIVLDDRQAFNNYCIFNIDI